MADLGPALLNYDKMKKSSLKYQKNRPNALLKFS